MKISLMKPFQISSDGGQPPINVKEMIMGDLQQRCFQAAENLINYVLQHAYGVTLAEVYTRMQEVRYESDPDQVDYFLTPSSEALQIIPDKCPDDWQWVATLWWRYAETTNEVGATTASLSFDFDTVLGSDIDAARIMPS